MPDRWLAELRRELAERRLPATYARQFINEIVDHVNDIAYQEDGMSIASNKDVLARMGTPADLAQQASQQFDYPTWLGRHPWIGFVIVPLPLLAFILFGYLAALVFAADQVGDSYKYMFGWAWGAMTYLIPIFCVAYSLAWFRSQRPVQWLIPCSAMAILLAGLLRTSVALAPEPGQSAASVSFGFSPMWMLMSPPFWLTLFVFGTVIYMAQRARAALLTA